MKLKTQIAYFENNPLLKEFLPWWEKTKIETMVHVTYRSVLWWIIMPPTPHSLYTRSYLARLVFHYKECVSISHTLHNLECPSSTTSTNHVHPIPHLLPLLHSLHLHRSPWHPWFCAHLRPQNVGFGRKARKAQPFQVKLCYLYTNLYNHIFYVCLSISHPRF